MNQLPIIDITPLYSADQTAWQSIATQIDRAEFLLSRFADTYAYRREQEAVG
ncbi:hypothetical protein [Pseudomonas sp. ZS1P83]